MNIEFSELTIEKKILEMRTESAAGPDGIKPKK
jgi:hypothetical protein